MGRAVGYPDQNANEHGYRTDWYASFFGYCNGLVSDYQNANQGGDTDMDRNTIKRDTIAMFFAFADALNVSQAVRDQIPDNVNNAIDRIFPDPDNPSDSVSLSPGEEAEVGGPERDD